MGLIYRQHRGSDGKMIKNVTDPGSYEKFKELMAKDGLVVIAKSIQEGKTVVVLGGIKDLN